MQTILQKNQDEIKRLLDEAGEMSVQSLIVFTENNRHLLGFFLQEIISFTNYRINAVRELETKLGVPYYFSLSTNNITTVEKYAPHNTMEKLLKIDSDFFWLIKGIKGSVDLF